MILFTTRTNVLQTCIYCYTVICIAFCILNATSAKHEFELIFENFTCAIEEDQERSAYFSTLLCKLNNSLRRRSVNMDISFKQNFSDFQYTMAIILPRPTMKFTLLNLTMNGCGILANRNLVPLVRIGRDLLTRYSNFPNRCPLIKDKMYYMRAFHFDVDLIPAVTMETPVQVFWHVTKDKKRLCKGVLLARVVYRNNNNINS